MAKRICVPLPLCLPLLRVCDHVVDPFFAGVGFSFREFDVGPGQETTKVGLADVFSYKEVLKLLMAEIYNSPKAAINSLKLSN